MISYIYIYSLLLYIYNDFKILKRRKKYVRNKKEFLMWDMLEIRRTSFEDLWKTFVLPQALVGERFRKEGRNEFVFGSEIRT
jgi:hypothetical protein